MFYEILDIYCRSYCHERVGFILAERCDKENCFCYLPSGRVRCITGRENRTGALVFLRICSAGYSFLTLFCQTFLSPVLQCSRTTNKRVSSPFTYYWKVCCTAQYCTSWSNIIRICVSSQKKQKCMLVRLVLSGKCIQNL